jgi:hypothetical protein
MEKVVFIQLSIKATNHLCVYVLEEVKHLLRTMCTRQYGSSFI